MHALVTGSSGYIGSRLIAALTANDFEVTATARDVAKLKRFDFPDSVRRLDLNVDDQSSCVAAFAAAGRVDVAYYLVHSIGENDYAERDVQSAQTFAAAAKDAGVSRVVYLGGFVPDGQELSEHLESRAEVGEALGSAGLDTVWLKAAVILGSGSTSFELVRSLADRLPVVPLPNWMQHVVAPIAVNDVLHYLVAAADPAQLPHGSYEISNDETLTYADVIKTYAHERGLRRLWLNLHGISPGFAAPFVGRLTPIPHNLVEDLVKSLSNTMNSDDHSIRKYVPDPVDGLTSLVDAIHRACPEKAYVPVGVCATSDPLLLTDTDPQWAGGRDRKAEAKAS